MRTILSLVSVVGLVCFAGCKKKDDDQASKKLPAQTNVAADPKPAASTATEPDAAGGTMANDMANCPSSVKGAKTRVADNKGLVTVTIIAKDADAAAVAEIRKRSAFVVGFNDADRATVDHSGAGTGSGMTGKCPVSVGLASLASEDIEGGSKITMTPRKDDGFPALLHAVRSRVQALKSGGGKRGADHGDHGGDGTGKGAGNGAGGGNEDGTKSKDAQDEDMN